MVPGSLSNCQLIRLILKGNYRCEFYLYPQKYPHTSDNGCCLLESVRDISGASPFPVPGKLSPGFGHRRTGLPCRNVGSGHRQHQEPLGRGQFPTTLTSLASYSPCCSLCRCISFCAELRNCALSKSLTLSPGLAKPRTPYIGLSIVFRFCAAPVRREVRNLRSL